MGFNSKFLFSLLILVIAVPLMVNGIVWNVGDDAGWSGQSQLDYTDWAAKPAFIVGDDSLRFVYDPYTTNVLEVSFTDYRRCDATSPLATYNSGNDTIPITKPEQFFISGNPVDCKNGLRIDIMATNSPYLRYLRSGHEGIPEDPSIGGSTTTQTSDSSTGGVASTPAMFAPPLMVNGFFWKVGNAGGWSGQSQYNYTDWALQPAFLVGDSLEFVYNPNITNVMEVTYCDFESCDATSPLATYNTGFDEVPITKVGHQYFISGNPVDCRNGLKVDIMATNSEYIRNFRTEPAFGLGYFVVPGSGWPYDEGADINGAISCDSDSYTASTPTMSPTSSTEACLNCYYAA